MKRERFPIRIPRPPDPLEVLKGEELTAWLNSPEGQKRLLDVLESLPRSGPPPRPSCHPPCATVFG